LIFMHFRENSRKWQKTINQGFWLNCPD